MGLKTRYIIVSPVKNEEAFFEKTLRSVVSQTVLPAEWIIIDDGSTDDTAKLSHGYEKTHGWIKVVSGKDSARARGGHIVRLFYEGLLHTETKRYDYVVKLDGDVSFEKDFFERILESFKDNPRLGISSGISHIRIGGRLVEERSSQGHTLGATKVYLKKCLDDIGGLVENMGWDGIDEIKARMRGWEAEPVPGLVVEHHRPEGKARGFFSSGMERGRGAYFMGYHPAFLLLRSIKCMFRNPPLLDGLGMLTGYLRALALREERIKDPEFMDFLRTNQIRKMLMLKNKV